MPWDDLALICRILSGAAALLLGVTFSYILNGRFAWLEWFDRHKFGVLFVGVACLIAGEFFDRLERQEVEHRDEERRAQEIEKLTNAILDLRREGYLAPDQVAPITAENIHEVALNAAVSIALNAEMHFTRMDFEEARLGYVKADELVEIAAIKARVADANFSLGDYQAALSYEQEAMKLAPNWSGPPYIAAFSLYNLGRTNEALPFAERSCRLGFEASCAFADHLKRIIENKERESADISLAVPRLD